jgi:uncharacterized metal-binding protein YceD (DUF177 family)
MIRIETGQIGEDGYSVAGEESGELLDLAQDPVARENGPIRYDLTVHRAGTELVVTGTVAAPLRLRCCRCAQFFSTTARVSSFLHAYEWAEHPECVDVSADVREDILLEIPGFPLCHAGCKGLCAQCGQDLNEGACSCGPPAGRPSPWAALDGWSANPGPPPPRGGSGPPRK